MSWNIFLRYGVSLNSENSNDGRITCNITSSFVGNQNASFIIEGEYGRSIASKDIRHVSWDQHIYMFQTYAGCFDVNFDRKIQN